MKKVFLSGIAGTGMSALAGLFKQRGYVVEGSDNNFYPPIGDMLKQMKVRLYKGYSEKNISKDTDFFILGNILSRGNPEVEYVLNNRFEYYSMADALYKFFIKDKYSVVVAGTHGKTTTTSFISFMLNKAGLNPPYFIAGKPLNLNNNYNYNEKGKYFVVEGDEYETSFFDRSSKFLKYYPYYLIINPLEYDHADFFKSEDLYLYAFKNLVNQVPSNGFIILNNDFEMGRRVVENSFAKVYTYSINQDSYFEIKDIVFNGKGYDFKLVFNKNNYEFNSSILGKYNTYNFVAGIIFGMKIGIDIKIIKEAVNEFKGVDRRMNVVKRKDNSIFVEDFAHHPTAIKLTLESLKNEFEEYNLICVLNPASNSLKSNIFENELKESLMVSDDIIIISPVYKKTTRLKKINLEVIRESLVNMGKIVRILEELEDLGEIINDYDFSKKNLFALLSNSKKLSQFII